MVGIVIISLDYNFECFEDIYTNLKIIAEWYIIIPMRTIVILVRHGETVWNKKGLVQGQTDIPLSKKGIQQAKMLAKRLKNSRISKIYASKLERAIKTAKYIEKEINIEIKTHAGLNERSFGQLEGKPWSEIEQFFIGKPEDFFLKTPKNGESYQTFEKRVIAVFDSILNKHKGETVAIVSHGGVIRVLIKYLSKTEIYEGSLPNTSVSIFNIENDQVRQELLADASHLPSDKF